jgi:protease-4
MRYFASWMILAVLLSAGARSQEGLAPYAQRNLFQLASAGALRTGLYGYDNPALVTYQRQPDIYFSWSNPGSGNREMSKDWGLFLAAPYIGLSAVHEKRPDGSVTDYRIATGFGDRAFGAGLAFGWSGGERDHYDRSSLLALGFLARLLPTISVGLTGTKALYAPGSEVTADLAVRPFATPVFALFGDYALNNQEALRDGDWSAGAVLEALPGIRLTGRAFNSKAFSIGIDLSLGHAGFTSQAVQESGGGHLYNSYGIRFGAYDRNVFDAYLNTHKSYLDIDLRGRIGYRRFLWFDRTKTLASLLQEIDAAQDDHAIAGIAINTSGMESNREMLWELRDKLRTFRAAGKHVVVFIDRAGMEEYHFASVADNIVMDPLGGLSFSGYVIGRTYVKGLLEKVGIGYDELRFFKYKSAAETFVRDNMSAADREQWQALVDAFYRLAKEEICASRHLTPARFDSLVNEGVVFRPEEALARGLVDTLGRWESVNDVIARLEGREKRRVGAGSLLAFQEPYDGRWGEPPRVALVYALGACDMDAGINARRLSKELEDVVNDPQIRAIVLRVDSPGGDALASDYVAEALRRAKGKKPVIVSQGQVAASGGYWLSMYADTIVASPTTMTGSIGVIGGWVYNKGLKEWLGLSTDKVQVGEHADLPFGFTFPFIGVGLPDRDLTPEERAQLQSTIVALYKQFLAKVAAGRKMTAEGVDSVGQGRVWSGYDGKDRGLVDLLGGLDDAISVAKARAGIPRGQEVTYVEIPPPGLFSLQSLLPGIAGIQVDQTPEPDPVIEQLKFRIKHNGEAIPMLPMDYVEMSR